LESLDLESSIFDMQNCELYIFRIFQVKVIQSRSQDTTILATKRTSTIYKGGLSGQVARPHTPSTTVADPDVDLGWQTKDQM